MPLIGEIAASTIESRNKEFVDNITNNNALLYKLKKKGSVKKFSGGQNIREEINALENSTVKSYQGYDTLDQTPQAAVTAYQFEIKQVHGSVKMNGLEELQNSGKEQIIDLLEGRINNLKANFTNALTSQAYSDGTGNGGKDIGGLGLLIPDDPSTGTVGGVDRADNEFARSQVYDAITDGGAAATAENIRDYMNQLYIKCTRNADQVDMIVAGDDYYNYYLSSLQEIQRITSSDTMAKGGFTTLKYMNADVCLGGGYNGAQDAKSMFFINSKYLFWRPHAKRNMVVDKRKQIIEQDAFTIPVYWAGNMTFSNAFLHGKLKETA